MKPVFTVFFDGLKPESLTYMPFLNSFTHKRRLKTILGYSIACHASMYSGVYPNKHGMWFLWQYSPQTSPFRWFKRVRVLNYFDCLPLRLVLHKLTTSFVKRTAYWGIPRIVNLPIRYWPYIDVSEKLFWDESGYLEGFPTVFELLRSNNVSYEVVGMAKTMQKSWELVQERQFTEIKPWTYIFIGEVDGLSHHFLQDSPVVIDKLRDFDAIVERRYQEFVNRVGEVDFFAFSDHGHTLVSEKINLYVLFHEAGEDLNKYLHLIDANYARFWFREPAERSRVEQILARIQNGFILTKDNMEYYHVNQSDNRYGELIYYLDKGSAFSWTTFGYGKKQNSLHGYLPDHSSSDGVFVSNHPIGVQGHVHLVDILPSLLSLLGMSIPDWVDGRIIWE